MDDNACMAKGLLSVYIEESRIAIPKRVLGATGDFDHDGTWHCSNKLAQCIGQRERSRWVETYRNERQRKRSYSY